MNTSLTFLVSLFTGVSGPVGIDAKGDRVASYRLQSFLSGMQGVRVANYFGTTGELQLLNQTIIWPGGTTKIPLGRPACGFDNELCVEAAKGMKQSNMYLAVSISLFGLINNICIEWFLLSVKCNSCFGLILRRSFKNLLTLIIL